MTTSELRPLRPDAEFADRLLVQYDLEIRELGIEWLSEQVPALRRRLTTEGSVGAIWVEGEGRPLGFSFWNGPVEVGRRWAWVHLVPGERSPERLGEFLDLLDTLSITLGPIVSLSEPILGITIEGAARCLRSRGFVRVVRSDMEFPETSALPPLPGGGPPVRSLQLSDEGEVGSLLVEAYADAPTERALFEERRDRREDGRMAVHGIFSGGLGEFWPGESRGIERDGRLVAAALVNDYRGPLISEVLVAPDARRRGYGRAVVIAAVEAVRARTRAPPRLVVTEENTRAVNLYESIGFRRKVGVSGGVWLRMRRPESSDEGAVA